MPKKTKSSRIAAKPRLRMYRHGLGDCFLLRFPGKRGKTYSIVIDCGVFKCTENPKQKMQAVAEDIEKVTGGCIDVLVVTHEHWDHLSGFHQAREVWDRIKVKDVWLAWTENKDEPIAENIKRRHDDMLRELSLGLAQFSDSREMMLDASRLSLLEHTMTDFGITLGLDSHDQTTRAALDYVAGRVSKPSYLNPGEVLNVSGAPGLRVFVLGPPKNDLIKKDTPSLRNPEVYTELIDPLSFAGDLAAEDGDTGLPFAPGIGLAVGDKSALASAFKVRFPEIQAEEEVGGGGDWRLLNAGGVARLEQLALALRNDTNNTSLALAFELPDGRVLLFPGDAQVGNWLSWQDYEWKVDDASLRMNDLFGKTVFYKVGHHGSHNATLKDLGLKKMTHANLMAYIPVEISVARQQGFYDMPFEPMLSDLKARTRGRVYMSDKTLPSPRPEDLNMLSTEERERLRESVLIDDLFIEFSL